MGGVAGDLLCPYYQGQSMLIEVPFCCNLNEWPATSKDISIDVLAVDASEIYLMSVAENMPISKVPGPPGPDGMIPSGDDPIKELNSLMV